MLKLGVGRKISFVPGIGINVMVPMGAAAEWWLSGGITELQISGAWQAKAIANLATSYIRLAGDEGNPNIDPAVIGVGVAPSWNAVDGWIGDGNAWLDTGIVPVENSLIIVRFTNANAGTNQAGCYSTTDATMRFSVRAQRSAITLSSTYWAGSLSAPGIDANLFTSGIISLYNQEGYRNTTLDSAVMAWPALVYHSIAILGVKSGAGSAAFKTSANVQAIFIGKPGISLAQFEALVAAIAAL